MYFQVDLDIVSEYDRLLSGPGSVNSCNWQVSNQLKAK